jgi:L-ascorbate metabolism protein UlaG (beta-lactamase superfamily)
MKHFTTRMLTIGIVILFSLQPMSAQFESDVITTSAGDLEMFFIGHGTLMFKFNGQVIHIDPVSREADYGKLPDADLILITHQHGDHLDISAIRKIMKEDTKVVMTKACMEQLEDFKAVLMKNGDQEYINGIAITAVPAYNIEHVRSEGNPYHPKGEGNGYLLTFGNTRVLVAGDTIWQGLSGPGYSTRIITGTPIRDCWLTC